MMKRLHAVLLIAALFVFPACTASEQVKPIKEETTDFDIHSAAKMVEEREKIIIEFALKEKLSKTEFGELEKSLTEKFGDHRSKEILSMFFDFGAADSAESGVYFVQDTLYPTVFHKGIKITDAAVYKSYFENDVFNQTRLTIREAYVGDDEKLKDWNREYIFIQNKDGEWEMDGFSGVMNFAGEGWNMNDLELKQ